MTSETNSPPSALLIVGSSNVFTFNKSVIKIGRLEGNDLILDNLSVSRNHAELRFHNGYYEITDLNSTGGTFVNGIKVTRKRLEKGDVITLAGVHLVFGQDEFPTSESTSRYTQPEIPPQKNMHTRNLSPNTVPIKKSDKH